MPWNMPRHQGGDGGGRPDGDGPYSQTKSTNGVEKYNYSRSNNQATHLRLVRSGRRQAEAEDEIRRLLRSIKVGLRGRERALRLIRAWAEQAQLEPGHLAPPIAEQLERPVDEILELLEQGARA